MIMVICSFIAEFVFMTGAAYYRDGISAWKTGLIASGIASLAGNNACFGMAVFSYISDVTPRDKLTSRTSISGSCFFMGLLAGLTIAGYLTEAPLPTVYVVAAILEVIVLLGIILLVKSKLRSEISTWTKIKDLFSPKYMVESLTSVFKRRPRNQRKILLLLLACHVLSLTPMSGDSSVEFLATRYRYSWDAATYSSYQIYKTVIGFIANFVSLAILSEYLQLSDPIIGIISCISLAASSVLSAFATTPTLAYIAPLASLLSGSVMAVSRTLVFRIVATNETGKINSFIGSLESLTPLIVVPVYTTLYSELFETFAGCYNLLSAIIMAIPISVYIWIHSQADALS
jgi:PCFT/HCP family folate transporter-like MFS transporter 1/3